jgi:predicted PurR-regulated permease PerM
VNPGLRIAIVVLLPLAVLLLGLVLLSDILLPFLVGLAAAYLLDPIADRLERMGVGRTMATTLITVGLVIVLIVVLLLLLPVVITQAAELARELPGYLERLRGRVLPILTGLMERFNFGGNMSAEGLIQTQSGRAMEVVVGTVGGLLQSTVALLNLIALFVVTPVVTFYLLRDWDRIVNKVRETVPPVYLETFDALMAQIDDVLAGFIRGQGLVCLFLAVFYSFGLWLVGLNYGVIIGLLTGLFSFIPYIGMALGFGAGIAVAAFQFQDVWMIALVAFVFALGQFIEGNLISPRLVGSRIGLHPVWVIFAVLAGTVLFGVLGTLLAVPVAGVLGVLLRFGLAQYRGSAIYREVTRSEMTPPRSTGTHG